MAKVKLDLENKSDAELRDFTAAHITAITGNANFPTPSPAAAGFATAQQDFADKLAAITTAENALSQLREERDALREALVNQMTLRGAYVEVTAAGDSAKIMSAGLQVKSDPTPTSSLPQPANLRATMGPNAGEIDLTCGAVAKAKSYIWECSEHPDNAAPSPWVQAKISARSSITVTGLTPGKRYAFRVRAIGPNEVLSPWSDEAISMSP